MLFDVFLMFLLGHVIGDFYLQNDKLAKAKNQQLSKVLLHSVIYSVALVFWGILFWSMKLLVAGIILGGIHGLVDVIKYALWNKGKKTPDAERNLYVLDQAVHLLSIFLVVYLFFQGEMSSLQFPWSFHKIGIQGPELHVMLLWLTGLLLAHRPANITIGKLIRKYRPKDMETGLRAGGFIGTLERFIMLILLALGQFAAVGLVLTAKSIARYDKISKEADFAEYYLLGTLLSLLMVILIYVGLIYNI